MFYKTMEEKEVRIPILGVIDEDKLECHDNMHLLKHTPMVMVFISLRGQVFVLHYVM